MHKLALRLFLALALLGLMLRGASACSTAFALGNLCTDHCSDAGEVLDDGTTCYCDPEKCKRDAFLELYLTIIYVTDQGSTLKLVDH